MNTKLQKKLFKIAEDNQVQGDSSHDFEHVKRVFHMAERIASEEGADKDIITAAALFHDLVVYPKNDPRSHREQEETAEKAEQILKKIKEFPKKKISAVKKCILECSFSKGITGETLESKILQDADRLDSTGAISIGRTFSSCGQTCRPFYNSSDPLFVAPTTQGPKNSANAMEIFHRRLLKVEKTLHTKLAKNIARKRTRFLNIFLKQWQTELKESGIIK